jgi:hypothetical protein
MFQRLLRLLALTLALAAAFPAAGFGFSQFPVTVVEFHNVILDHYFLTANSVEAADIDAGRAGPGWIKTGRGFTAFLNNPPCFGCLPTVAVARFYGTPGLGPNSHFYTENPAEAEGLRQPGTGWSPESDAAFYIPVPDANGNCPAQAPVPVYRLYNNRWMFNDSNHRYVTNAGDRTAMIAAGWLDEGVHFCVPATEVIPIKRFDVSVPLDGNILPSAECENDAVRTGGCIAVNNLPIPRTPLFSSNDETMPFWRLTDVISSLVFVTRLAPIEVAAADVFVQGVAPYYGIHVDTKGKAVPALSSLNPLYQFPSEAAAPARRFYPWRANYPFDTELSIQWFMEVRRIEARGPDSHAYGHPTLEFIDEKSGRHLYFTVLAYGTIAGGDYLALDVGSGKVIVGTTPRADTPYGRSLRDDWMPVARSFDAGNGSTNRAFDFRIDRSEFLRILAAARSVDPQLSADPGDYLMDNFHFNNEVYGDGEIGMRIALTLNVLRR